MDAAGTALAQLVRQRMSPVVMVMPTARVEETCRKNHLGFVDLLRPFCILDQINVPVRTASEQPYRLQDFQLRMFYASEICQPSPETAEDYLVEVVSNSSDDAAAALQGDPKDIEVVKKMAESETQASWFQRYSREYMRTLAFSEHEALDHPVACLLVVSSMDVSPLTQFVDLFNGDSLPGMLNDGAMDPKLLKHYLLLHDVQDGPLEGKIYGFGNPEEHYFLLWKVIVNRAAWLPILPLQPGDWQTKSDQAFGCNDILYEMRGAFGVNNCGVLPINSGSPDAAIPTADVWTGHLMLPIAPKPQEAPLDDAEVSNTRPGSFLSKSDIAEITDFMLDLTLKQIIPHMEQKIRMLNQQVSATRKGLKNQIKNLWWRKGKEENPDVQTGSMYTFSSMESQIRVLADYAFMLRDYDLALANYRLLSSDYKTDKAWKRYAGVQEMIGLCLFMLDQSRREAEMCMDTAYNYYQKCGDLTAKYATRTALWLAEMHKVRGQFREAAGVLFRASVEEANLRAGVLLEQAAYCYLRASPPMLRKFGFHMVLAGNRYTVSSQRKHAMRVYRSVLSIFEGQGWKYISDHVHFHLGRLSHFLGSYDLAIVHFMKLIACSHQSPANQSNFLREFLYVVQNTVGKDKLLDLELPAINVEQVHVHFEDHRTYSSSAAAAMPEELWSAVEEGLTPSVAVTLHTWLDAPNKSVAQAKDFNICVAGEEIVVDVEFTNPLQIPIEVSSVCLICEFVDKSASEAEVLGAPVEGDRTERTSGTGDPHSLEPHGSSDDPAIIDDIPDTSASPLCLPEESFSMKPGEKSVVHLRAKPIKEGVLRVVGVKWILNGTAAGRRDFAVTGVLNKKYKSRGRNEAPPNQLLKFNVLGHMPRLEASMHELPAKVNIGELNRVVLELYNPSKVPIKKVKMKTSHPNFLLVGEAGDLDMEFPSCLEVQAGLEGPHELQQSDIPKHDGNSHIFSFPEDMVLEGGSTLLWPLWLHARHAGTVSINSAIYYESDIATGGLKYRTVRMTHTIHHKLDIITKMTKDNLMQQLKLEKLHEPSMDLRTWQVVPSLQVSVQISPSPLHLQQFLLRLDVENQHSSESFWLRQVSCAGDRWYLAPLSPPVMEQEGTSGTDSDAAHVRAALLSSSVCPSQLLPPSQKLSLFFKLLVAQREGKTGAEEVINIGLGPPSSREPLIDIASGPLFRFLVREKLQQPRPPLPYFLQPKKGADKRISDTISDGGAVDVVLISEQQEGMAGAKAEVQDSLRVGAHHICHCSVQGSQPFVWVMEGPTCIGHDFFKQPFCEVCVYLTVRNCSGYTGSVKVETLDSPATAATTMSAQDKEAGWTALGPTNSPLTEAPSFDSSAVSTSTMDESDQIVNRAPSGPFLWCNLRSTTIHSLPAGASAKIPLRVAFLAPGIYDLSRYRISWTLLGLQPISEITDPPVVSSLLLKTTMATYATGYAPPADVGIQTGNSLVGDAASTGASGVGLGHPLLLTVIQAIT